MLQSIKRLTKHSLVYGIGHIISRSIGFLLLPIHTNVLPLEQYRNAALLFSSLAILNVIFSYGMDVAFLRFFILEENRENKRTVFSTAYWMIAGTGILFSALMVLFPHPFSTAIFGEASQSLLIRLAAGILFLDAVVLIPFLVLRAEEKSGLFVILKTVNIVLNLGLNILWVIVLKKGVPGIFISNLVSSGVTLLILVPILWPWLRFRFRFSVLRELLEFGLPYIPSGLAVIIMDQIGRFFLDRLVSKEATAVFSAGYKLGMFMALIVAAFRFAWHPFFLSTSKQEDAPSIFGRVLTYFLIITGFFFLILSFFLKEIVGFHLFGFTLIGQNYLSSITIVPVVMIAYMMYGVYTNFVVGIYLSKKTVLLPLVTGSGAAVAVLANMLLIPRFGINGAAWATFLAYSVMAIALYAVSRRLYKIVYEWFRVGAWMLVLAVVFFLGTTILGQQHFLFRIGLLGVLIPILWITGFIRKDEKTAINRWLKRRVKHGAI